MLWDITLAKDMVDCAVSLSYDGLRGEMIGPEVECVGLRELRYVPLDARWRSI
jgi:hypothetical protein